MSAWASRRCVCACARACVRERECGGIWVWMDVLVGVYVYVCVFMCVYVCMRLGPCAYVGAPVCVCVCVCVLSSSYFWVCLLFAALTNETKQNTLSRPIHTGGCCWICSEGKRLHKIPECVVVVWSIFVCFFLGGGSHSEIKSARVTQGK